MLEMRRVRSNEKKNVVKRRNEEEIKLHKPSYNNNNALALLRIIIAAV